MDMTKIKVTISLESGGTRRIKIHAPSPEAHDLALRRLERCLPQLELLESSLQKSDTDAVANQS